MTEYGINAVGIGLSPPGAMQQFFKGQVNTFADLPMANNSVADMYSVKNASGVWLINRKPSGFYSWDGSQWVKTADYDLIIQELLKKLTKPVNTTPPHFLQKLNSNQELENSNVFCGNNGGIGIGINQNTAMFAVNGAIDLYAPSDTRYKATIHAINGDLAIIAPAYGTPGISFHTGPLSATRPLQESRRLYINERGIINIPAIPLSPAGLNPGDIWNNGGFLCIR